MHLSLGGFMCWDDNQSENYRTPGTPTMPPAVSSNLLAHLLGIFVSLNRSLTTSIHDLGTRGQLSLTHTHTQQSFVPVLAAGRVH